MYMGVVCGSVTGIKNRKEVTGLEKFQPLIFMEVKEIWN